MPYVRFMMYVEYMNYLQREGDPDLSNYNRDLDRQDELRFGKIERKGGTNLADLKKAFQSSNKPPRPRPTKPQPRKAA